MSAKLQKVQRDLESAVEEVRRLESDLSEMKKDINSDKMDSSIEDNTDQPPPWVVQNDPDEEDETTGGKSKKSRKSRKSRKSKKSRKPKRGKKSNKRKRTRRH